MKLGDVWFSAIAEAENSDRMIVVSGRTEIEPFIQSGKFKERVEITWKYEADSKGMPNETTGKTDGRSADRIETGYGKR